MADIFDNSSLLMFRVGPVYCCAPSFPVESIIQPPEMTRTPGSNTAHPGLFKHSGNMVSGLDLRYQFGVDKQDWTKPGRMIIAGVDAGVIGFWVDQIIDVLQMPQTGWGSLPPLLPRGVFTRTLLSNDKIYLFAEFEKLFSIPTSGYLRPYIEHLIEIEQKTQQQSAVGQSPARTSANFSARNSATSSNAVGSSPSSKPTGQSRSKTEKRNVLPLRERKTSINSSSKSEKETSDQNSTAGNSERDSTGKVKLQEKSVKLDSVNTSHLQTKPVQNSSLKNEATETSGQDQTTKAKPSRNVPFQNKPFENKLNKQPINHRKSLETRTALNGTKSITHKNTEQHHPAAETKTNAQSTSSRSIATSGVGNSLFETNTTIQSPETMGDELSVWPMILILLLIVGIGSGAFWFLTEEPKKKPPLALDSIKHEQTPPASNDILNSEVAQTASVTEATSTAESTITSAPDPEVKERTTNTATEIQEQDQPVNRNQETIGREPGTPITEVASATEIEVDEPSSPTEITATDYKADIVQDQEGITIILETPDDAPIFKAPEVDEQLNATPETEAATSKLDRVVSDSTDKPVTSTPETDTIELVSVSDQTEDSAKIELVETSEEAATTNTQTRAMEPVTRQQMTEIIHIVKKGDTLWHIAIRYVNNPYRYPELARLSNIKNPDLIYPGNRVRIIKRHKIKE